MAAATLVDVCGAVGAQEADDETSNQTMRVAMVSVVLTRDERIAHKLLSALPY